jgi:MerR family transcriptional regulator, light-induced transcriptional regulator
MYRQNNYCEVLRGSNVIDELISSCLQLPKVSKEAAEAYVLASERLLEQVNEQMEDDPRIRELIGHNSFELMRENHRNHAKFMAAVFSLNSFDLMVKTVPWVYRAYHARGFQYDYFPAELIAWQIAMHQCFDQPEYKDEILAIYRWLVQYHDEMIKLSISSEGLTFLPSSEVDEMQQIFLLLLLHGDAKGCLKFVDQNIKTVDDLRYFYLDVVWPSMCKIGQMWELNQISVAEEHLASAIVGRVMASLYPRFATFNVSKGFVIVSAGPNEYHEIGARMVADLLELDGWDVTYLGANTPIMDMIELFKKQKPFFVAISVATLFNLDKVRQAISIIRQNQEISGIKIMVGGLAFSGMPELWREIGADGYAGDAGSAVKISGEWWREGNNLRLICLSRPL